MTRARPRRTAIADATATPVTGDAPAPPQLGALQIRRKAIPVIEGYTILRRLGEGSGGTAYLAKSRDDTRCVIKTIDFEGSSQTALFFIREAQTGFRMNHPNAVRVMDFGESGGLLFLAMEYLEGGSLRERIDVKPLTSREAIGHLAQLAGALDHAARQRFVHRDIKPANILLTAEGVPKLADWGLAKMLSSTEYARITRTGDARGTPMYMAPEVVLDATRGDTRSDLYSLGATYYHALSGQTPFAVSSIGQVLEDVLGKEPKPLEASGVPADLAHVIRRLMNKRPEDRYANPAELLRELQPLK